MREGWETTEESAASFSKRERREETAGGGADSMPSEDCGAVMAAVWSREVKEWPARCGRIEINAPERKSDRRGE